MTDLLTRIRAHVAQIPTHRCDGCYLVFTSETMTCPSCGLADRTRWISDSEANRLLREVAALEPVGFATHHDEPMLFPTEEEARMYCDDDEVPRGLYALTGDSHG